MSCSFCGDGPYYEAPGEGDLADFIGALLSGDNALARILVTRIFPDAQSVGVCERALQRAQQSRSAV